MLFCGSRHEGSGSSIWKAILLCKMVSWEPLRLVSIWASCYVLFSVCIYLIFNLNAFVMLAKISHFPLSVTNDDDDFNHAQMQLFCCHPSAASMLRHKQFLLKIHHNIVHMCTKNITNMSTCTESTKILHTYSSYMPSYLCLLLRYRYKPYLALLRHNTKIFNHPTSGKLKCNVSNSGIIGWPQLQIM